MYMDGEKKTQKWQGEETANGFWRHMPEDSQHTSQAEAELALHVKVKAAVTKKKIPRAPQCLEEWRLKAKEAERRLWDREGNKHIKSG